MRKRHPNTNNAHDNFEHEDDRERRAVGFGRGPGFSEARRVEARPPRRPNTDLLLFVLVWIAVMVLLGMAALWLLDGA